jgi:hypothetical protein
VSREMAILSVIVEVSSADFYMTSDGRYQGSGKFKTAFSDIKLTSRGGRPLIDGLGEEFDTAVGNLQWIPADQASTRRVSGLYVKTQERFTR